MVREFFVLHRTVRRTQSGVLTPGYFEPRDFPSLIPAQTPGLLSPSEKCDSSLKTFFKPNGPGSKSFRSKSQPNTQSYLEITLKIDFSGGFPGGPVAKTLSSQCRGPRFDLWSGN